MSHSQTNGPSFRNEMKASGRRYAFFAFPLVILLVLVWYLSATLLVAPTIDGPAADSVQGFVGTTGTDLVTEEGVLVPNAASEVDQ